MRIASAGHLVFAATLVVLGVLGLVERDHASILAQVPKTLPGREALPYLWNALTLACGVGLVFQRTAAIASAVLLGSRLLWMLAFIGPIIVKHPAVEVAYQNWGEHAVVVAAAWALYAAFAPEGERRSLGFITGGDGVRIARTLYALALIAFGFSHWVYLQNTASLVPAWLGWTPVGWSYFTGIAYIAAAVAILTGVLARLAAVLTALQMFGFLIFVWVPIVAKGHISTMNWTETVTTWALTAAAWVVADTWRGTPWLALSERRGA